MIELKRTGERLARALAWSAFTAWLVTIASVASAQAPPPRRGPAIDMQVVAESLGVDCDYCHTPRIVTANGTLRLEVARQMIAMTADLNARVQAATSKTATE